MNSTSRQDALVRLLRRRGTATVDELASQLAVSRRTVLRDIGALRDQGFGLNASSGPGGGVSLDPATVLVSAKLTSAEAFALLLSVAVIREAHKLPFGQLAEAGLAKIEQSLPRDRVLELRRILECVYIGQPSVEMPALDNQRIDESVLPGFEAGFLQQRRIRFSYSDRHGKRTRRDADPHAMLVLSPYWYLVGFDPEKGDFRHFRMDRISRATLLEHRFRRRRFSLSDARCPFKKMRWRA